MTKRSERGVRLLAAALLLAACAEAQPADTAPDDGRLAAGGRHGYATTSHTCAVIAGELQCWGAADRGQVGDRRLSRRRPFPVRVEGLSAVQSVAAGGAHSCAIVAGRVFCFGDNGAGQGGRERPYVLLAPEAVAGLPEPATQLAAGALHSCAAVGGRVWCWGRNEAGESGAAIREGCREPFRVRRCSVPPTVVAGVEGPVTALALGERHGCALQRGEVLCWGANDDAELGDGTRTASARAQPVAGLPAPATAIAAGRRHSCALVAGSVLCWGAGRPAPVAIEGVPPGVRRLVARGDRSCAAGDRAVHCWDVGGRAAAIAGIGAPVRALALGQDHGCVLADGDRVHCWGENDAGQLGRGPGDDSPATAQPVATWDREQLRDRDGDGRIRIVCLGDSNTFLPGAGPSWCDRLPDALPAAFASRVVNRGLGGATATREGSLLDASAPLSHVLASDAPDVAILAYGTNDLLAGVETGAIVAALASHVDRLHAAGVRPLLALVPPLRSQDVQANHQVQALNRSLQQAFPSSWLIDFWTGFGDAELVDRVHWNAAGQARRAAAAAEALLRFPLESAP